MAVALVTTFYGVMLANLVFMPIAKKLKTRSAKEYYQKQMFLEGPLSIQDGENPRIIRDKPSAFLTPGEMRPKEEQTEEVKETEQMSLRRKPPPEKEGGSSWMDTYGDMVTLLLTFLSCFSLFPM